LRNTGDSQGYIALAEAHSTKTDIPGLFACGDGKYPLLSCHHRIRRLIDPSGHKRPAAAVMYGPAFESLLVILAADKVYRQAITSAGSGAMAALDAERWLSQHK